MAITRLKMTILAVFLAVAIGCGPAPTTGPAPGTPGGGAATGTVDFSANGTAYTAPAGITTAYATYVVTTYNGTTYKNFVLKGIILSPSRSVSLSISGLGGPGTAPLGPYITGGISGTLTYSDSLAANQMRAFCTTNGTFVGTATLTKLDTVAKLTSGTFSGKVKQYYLNDNDSVTVTAGSFTDVPIK